MLIVRMFLIPNLSFKVYDVQENQFNMIMARFEPENNLDMGSEKILFSR
jgi:hypothetical protein